MMKALAGLLCVLLAGCVAAQPSSSTSPPSASITVVCEVTYCLDVPEGGVIQAAVLRAVAGVGYPVKIVSFGYLARSCPVPPAPPCLFTPSASVRFVGTDETAEVQLGIAGGRPEVDAVVLFGVFPGDSAQPQPDHPANS